MVLSNGTLSVDFEAGDITLEKISCEPYEIKNTFLRGDSLADSVKTGSERGEMAVKIEGYIKGDVDENRRILSKMCVPSSNLTLVDGEYILDLVPTSALKLSDERAFRDKLLKYTLYAEAPSPYWHGSEISETFYKCALTSTDDNAIRITNVGDLPTGCVIRAYLMSNASSLRLWTNGKVFLYSSALETLDSLYIDTRYGKKSVMLDKESLGARDSVIENVAPYSDFFPLEVGENRIDFVVAEGIAYITVTYTPIYVR